MEDFESLVRQLISLNLKNRSTMISSKVSKVISPVQYLMEYCTIHVDIGRASGKSKFIFKHLTERDLIVTHSPQSASRIQEEFNERVFTNKIKLNIVFKNPIGYRRPENPFLRMFIDEPNLCFSHIDIYEIYQYFCKDGIEQTVVMLGK